MPPTFLLEAFGQLSPGSNLSGIDSGEERDGLFHRVFEARAELMSWSTGWDLNRRPLLWNMYDAGLTDETDASLIGWVYGELSSLVDINEAVPDLRNLPRITKPEQREPEAIPEGTNAGWATVPMPPRYNKTTVEIPLALPPLVQCFDDALRRLGAVEVSGFQATWYGAHLGPSDRSSQGHPVSGVSWFDISPQAAADALITFDSRLLGGHTEGDLVTCMRRWRTGAFEFGPPVAGPGQHQVRVPDSSPRPDTPLEPSGLGIPVRLPEWTGSAAGWALARVVFAARDLAPDVEDFAVRITRAQ